MVPLEAQARPAWLAALVSGGADEAGECSVPPAYYDATERPIALRVDLRPPLGLLLGEVADGAQRAKEGASLVVDDVLEGSSAARSGKVQRGDRLVSVDGVSTRDASLDEVMRHQAPRQREGRGVLSRP